MQGCKTRSISYLCCQETSLSCTDDIAAFILCSSTARIIRAVAELSRRQPYAYLRAACFGRVGIGNFEHNGKKLSRLSNPGNKPRHGRSANGELDTTKNRRPMKS